MAEITENHVGAIVGPPTDQALRELLDAERHQQGVDERRRRHWLRHQAEDPWDDRATW